MAINQNIITKLIAAFILYFWYSKSHGEYHRSQKAKTIFKYSHPYPATGQTKGSCPDYIDHIKPLACGGADDPSNMQWQTKADAKAKDKWELKGC